eukprot:364152-Chlamydomonas_euryale.AAC.5
MLVGAEREAADIAARAGPKPKVHIKLKTWARLKAKTTARAWAHKLLQGGHYRSASCDMHVEFASIALLLHCQSVREGQSNGPANYERSPASLAKPQATRETGECRQQGDKGCDLAKFWLRRSLTVLEPDVMQCHSSCLHFHVCVWVRGFLIHSSSLSPEPTSEVLDYGSEFYQRSL